MWTPMPRQQRPPPPHSGFNLATLVQIGAIPVLTIVFYFVGNYFITGNTLSEHTKELASIEHQRQRDREDEQLVREKTRQQYMDYQQKTTDILSKLDTRLAVSETKQEVANQTLSKIADQLTKIGATGKGL